MADFQHHYQRVAEASYGHRGRPANHPVQKGTNLFASAHDFQFEEYRDSSGYRVAYPHGADQFSLQSVTSEGNGSVWDEQHKALLPRPMQNSIAQQDYHYNRFDPANHRDLKEMVDRTPMRSSNPSLGYGE